VKEARIAVVKILFAPVPKTGFLELNKIGSSFLLFFFQKFHFCCLPVFNLEYTKFLKRKPTLYAALFRKEKNWKRKRKATVFGILVAYAVCVWNHYLFLRVDQPQIYKM